MVVSDKLNVMPDSAKTLNGKQGLTVDRKHRLKHRFEVVKKLGQGTYGKVQLAVNKETGQEVAIKTIKKSKIESEQDLIRIRREIQIMSSVQHPHIIHIYEVFENKEKIVLVMQYASGGELYDYLSEKKVLSDSEARRVFRQIAAAIYYCHKNKICHRDLKLENVLLDERGNAKIADFGLSNVFDDRHLLATYCGSPLYASPEIVKGTPYYGPEVDCWSMGVLLYTLVYGAMPFDGSNFKRLVKQISEGDYYEPKKKSDASGLIRHLLTVSPTKRANIIDICSDWWVNMGFEHSLLQVAEDTANLTPVRIDLLLALAPVSPPPTGKEEPSFTKPESDETLMSSSGVEDCEETGESHDENGAMTSDSFAYISGGMAAEMVSEENPDDIFQEKYGSDEEFLSAEAAAELDGQCVKRRAEKSFDGSMVRVSSMAHKNKKPKKSESIEVSRSSGVGSSNTLEDRPEIPGENLEDNLIRKLSSATLVEEDISICKPDVKEETIPEAVIVTPIPELKQEINIEAAEVIIEPLVKSNETTVVSTENDDTVKTPKKKSVKAEPVLGTSPPKEKKVKRKIVSSSAKKTVEKASDKTENDSTAISRSQSPSKQRETSPNKIRDKSPVKPRDKSPEKSRVRSPSKPRAKSPDKARGKSPEKPKAKSPETAKSKSPEKPTENLKLEKSQTPETEKKDLKKSVTTPGRIIIRRRSEAPSPDKSETQPKPSLGGSVRRPGKLVMPRFLDTSPTPSPKATTEPKKLILPIRSVTDAKRAFETKSKSIDIVPIAPTKKADIKKTSPQKESEKPSESSISKTESQEPLKIINGDLKTPEGTTLETEKTRKKVEAQEMLVNTPSPDELEKRVNSLPSDSSSPTPLPKSKDEIEEEKKLAAKSILKKTIARAKLVDKKLSQQNSLDSDGGSQCTTPPVSSLPSTPPIQQTYFKVPKPYSRTQSDNTVQSKAAIILVPQPDRKEATKAKMAQKESQEETIWGTPMSPGSTIGPNLKRSVLSTSIESEMNNWRQEIEESLKRLSPEGAAEETNYNSQNSVEDDNEGGPTPIARSYKKFTFTKDGSCITETGEVYTEPAPDGTWTKVEKKTKVTTQPQKPVGITIKPLGSPKTNFEPTKIFKDASPLRHSDSQSSSGSNDIFDDIFDSWTGDSMFNNLLKMNSAFNRFTKDSLKRHDRRRTSLRRPKVEEKEKVEKPNEQRTGYTTNRESSDNEDDFDFHFDGANPVSCGSEGLRHFMKDMNKDFNQQLRAFKERHGSYSRSLSRDRGEMGSREFRSRVDSKPGSGNNTMTRSISRDRAESPRSETVLRFVFDSPKRQTSVRSEPRGSALYDAWGSRERLSGKESFDRDRKSKESGVGSTWDGYNSDHTTKYSSPLDSPDIGLDRSSLYGNSRPKAFHKSTKNWPKESPESPSTPQSTRSGPELYDKASSSVDALTDNRRRRVERWLETNPDGSLEKEPDLFTRTTRSLLSDVPEFVTHHDSPLKNKSGFMKYSRSSTDKLSDFDDFPNRHFKMDPNQRSQSQANLEQPIRRTSRVNEAEPVRMPMFRTISQIQVSNKFNGSQESLDRGQADEEFAQSRNSSTSQLDDVPPTAEKPPRMTRTSPHAYATYTRSSSNNSSQIGITANADGSIEMEGPPNGRGSTTPLLRMRVSFNPTSSEPPKIVPTQRDSQVWPSSSGIWNQELPSLWRGDFDDGSSLLEALKSKGYRNVISQRLFRDSPTSPQDADPAPSETETGRTDDPRQPQETSPAPTSTVPDQEASSRAEPSGNAAPKRATVTWQITPGRETVVRWEETPVITCTIGMTPPEKESKS